MTGAHLLLQFLATVAAIGNHLPQLRESVEFAIGEFMFDFMLDVEGDNAKIGR